MTKDDYLKLLQRSYEIECSWQTECYPDGYPKSSFIASGIFDLSTYDDELDEKFTKQLLEVCNAITQRKTWDLVRNPRKYPKFILYLHLPFFKNKITWGTSIRGAFWDYHKIQIKSCELWDEDEKQILSLDFSHEEWTTFLSALNKFYVEK